MDSKKLLEIVKKIRIETGLSIGEIKSAVEKAEGSAKQNENIETKAKELLKELGVQKMEKRAEKEVHQGRVATYTHSTGKIGVMVELLCETDFVASNEEYINVTKALCLQVAAMAPKSTEELLEMEYIKDSTVKIKDLISGLVAKFGGNIKLGRMERFEI